MASRQQTTSQARQAGCPRILFEDENGIYFLRGENLSRAKKLLNLSCDGKGLGFDPATARLHFDDLIEQGVSVGIVRDNRMRTITRQQPNKPEKVESRTVWLAPNFLFDERELSCLKRRLNGHGSSLRDLVEMMRPQIAGGDARDFGTLYVYQVAEDLYEIDWELTTASKMTVEALALVAYETGQTLRCELVPPKSKRGRAPRQVRRMASAPKPHFLVSEPVAYGQLRFDI